MGIREIHYTEEVIIGVPRVELFDRTYLRRNLEDKKRNFRNQNLRLVKGVFQLDNDMERCDVGRFVYEQQVGEPIYYYFYCDALLVPYLQCNRGSSVILSLDEKIKVQQQFTDWYQGEGADYVATQMRWFREKPWIKVVGKTVEEAIEILRELGW